jgi:RND family efflux transporter MFP subunit
MSQKSNLGKFLTVFILGIIIILALGFYHRWNTFKAATEKSEGYSLRSVSVGQPVHGNSANSLTFPGRLEGYRSADIYSRVNGYLKKWYKDIGSPVKAGEILGQIESPEIDQQFQQAQSELIAAVSNEQLAEVSFKRWQNLLKDDAVSEQDVDQKRVEYESKKALRKIAESNLERAKVYVAYKNIPSPFTGILTDRTVDIGDLISNGGGKPLFVIKDVEKLRLYINLPQIFLNDIKPGLAVELSVPEYPGRKFKAQVRRSSGSVNNQSGSSLVEIELVNSDHALTAGEYAQVSLKLSFDASLLRVPASALIVRKDGSFVAEVNDQQKVVFKPVVVSRDFGQQIEVIGEITESSRIIIAPPDTLVAGETVKVETNSSATAATPARQ